jgi:hypothetical protein
MKDFLIYLCLPPYLAQWYANDCNQVHNRDKATCSREIYRFPTPVVPVRGSQESGVIQTHLQKQPVEGPQPAPDNATIAIVIPSFPYKPVEYYNYVPRVGLEHLEDTIRNRFQVELYDDIHEARRITPKARIDLLISAWMEDHCIEDDDTNFRTLLKIYQRRREAYLKACRAKKSKKSL